MAVGGLALVKLLVIDSVSQLIARIQTINNLVMVYFIKII